MAPSTRTLKSRDAKITPLPLQASAVGKLRRVFVYGGTFDPPHKYHLTAVRIALGWLGAGGAGDTSSVLLYVPAAQSPLKGTEPRVSDEHRVAMLRVAQLGQVRDGKHARGREPFGFVWTDEIDRAGAQEGKATPSYTIDTIKRLRKLLPKACEVRIVIGVDQVLQLHKWKDARELVKLAPPLLLPRDDVDTPLKIAMKLWGACDGFWSREEIGVLAMSLLPVFSQQVSSTQLREKLAGKERAKALKGEWLTGDVELYIKQHKLYLAEDSRARGAKR